VQQETVAGRQVQEGSAPTQNETQEVERGAGETQVASQAGRNPGRYPETVAGRQRDPAVAPGRQVVAPGGRQVVVRTSEPDPGR